MLITSLYDSASRFLTVDASQCIGRRVLSHVLVYPLCINVVESVRCPVMYLCSHAMCQSLLALSLADHYLPFLFLLSCSLSCWHLRFMEVWAPGSRVPSVTREIFCVDPLSLVSDFTHSYDAYLHSKLFVRFVWIALLHQIGVTGSGPIVILHCVPCRRDDGVALVVGCRSVVNSLSPICAKISPDFGRFGPNIMSCSCKPALDRVFAKRFTHYQTHVAGLWR